MERAGRPPEFVCAFRKTGLIGTQSNKDRCLKKIVNCGSRPSTNTGRSKKRQSNPIGAKQAPEPMRLARSRSHSSAGLGRYATHVAKIGLICTR